MNRYNSSAATLHIVSHNTNRSSNALETLLNTAGKTADIVLVQEAKIKDIRYATTHPDFILLLPPRGTPKVNSTAAYVSRLNPNLRVTPHPDICNDPDLQVLEVQTDLIPRLYLLNMYNEFDPLTRKHTIPRTLPHLPPLSWCIITGDLNVYHSLWNSQTRRHARADDIVTLIEDHGWHLVNVPDTPTYHYRNGTGSSVIDLMIAVPAVAREVTDWAIDEDHPTGSDHEVVRFNIVTLHPDAECTHARPCLNWCKTDWDTFASTLQTLSEATKGRWSLLQQDPTPEHLDEWATILRDSIQTAAERSAAGPQAHPQVEEVVDGRTGNHTQSHDSGSATVETDPLA
jgi:hypothetical protein